MSDVPRPASLASWVQYHACRCREIALELEVLAGSVALSGEASNDDGMEELRRTAAALRGRAAAVAHRLGKPAAVTRQTAGGRSA